MGGVQSRANTPPHPKEMAGFGLLGQVFQLGMSYLDEAPEQTQDTLHRLHLSAGLGTA